jgi:hypothetical protein
MRRFGFILLVLLSGCSWDMIGDLTMVSTRNVDSDQKYVELRRNVEGETDDMKIEMAINNAVRKVPGGEYMMNVKVEERSDGDKLRVRGDVYGTPREQREDQILAGDSVMVQRYNDTHPGKVLKVLFNDRKEEYEYEIRFECGCKTREGTHIKEFDREEVTQKN